MSDLPNILTEAAPPPPPPSPADAAPAPFAVRIWSAFTLASCLGMLAVGLVLTPSSTGAETHRQLGLPPCGFYHATGYPCPTCGCTTAVSHFSHGHFIASFLTQPFGFAVAALAFVLIPLTLIGLATGKWFGPSMFALSWYWRRWLYPGIAIFIFAWIFKIISVKTGHG